MTYKVTIIQDTESAMESIRPSEGKCVKFMPYSTRNKLSALYIDSNIVSYIICLFILIEFQLSKYQIYQDVVTTVVSDHYQYVLNIVRQNVMCIIRPVVST